MWGSTSGLPNETVIDPSSRQKLVAHLLNIFIWREKWIVLSRVLPRNADCRLRMPIPVNL